MPLAWNAALVLLLAPAAAAAEARERALPEPTTAQAVRFEAERFEYERRKGEMHLSGDVRVWDDTWTIRAQELWLDMDSRVGRALGELRLEDGLTRVDGEGGRFDFASREGEVGNARAYYAPWRIRGRQARVDAQRELWYREARFTSCSENPFPEETSGPIPHYHFRASRVHVKPKKYIVARSVFLYIGKVPVFYTPVLWKSLRPRHILRTRFSPGYDRRNGPFVRTNTLYSFHPAWQGKLFVDYYSRPGLGAGNELQYFAGEDGRGALYAYGIKDQTTDKKRWALLGDHFQALTSTYSVQARLQAQSDPGFHNDYTRANAFRVTQQLVNSIAFVRATALTTTRLVYSRVDDGDAARPFRFLRTSESTPRLDFVTAPISPFRLPFLHTFRLFADNNFDRARGFQQKTTGGGWEVTQTKRLMRGVSLSPRAAIEEAYFDRHDALTSFGPAFGSTRTVQDVFIGRLDLGGTLRVNNPLGATDLTHAFRQRTKPDTLEADAGAWDHGVESNLLGLAHGFRPSRRVYARVQTGYDFREFRTHEPGFRERVQAFAGDLSYSLPRGWDLTLHEEYQLQEGNRSVLVQADWGSREGRFLRLGLANQRPQERHYFLAQEVGWSPKDGSWQLAGALRTDLRTAGGFKFDALQVFEKELSLRKDFHDFHTLLVFRSRPGGVQEIQFRVNLRVEAQDVWRRRVYTDYTGR